MMQGDYNHDMGLILLDRPMGAIVGTLPYSANYDEDDYYHSPFMHFGYSGKNLYQIDTTVSPDWLNWNVDGYQADVVMMQPYVLAGTKGAGLSFSNCVDDSENPGNTNCKTTPNILNGVLSRFGLEGEWLGEEYCGHPWCGYNTRITDTKAADIASYTKTTVPTTPDLMPLYVHVGDGGSDFASTSSNNATLFIGSTYNVCVLIHNNSTANANNVSTTVDFYLSVNSTISTTDRYLDNISGIISPTALSTTPYCKKIVIPDYIAQGTYYIGVISSFSKDYDTLNNTTAPQDILKIKTMKP